MTIQINRNTYWSQLFVKQLSALGVKEVSISPGSRSTPLTYAFATNKDFRKYVNIDERSSAYFALGLAKQNHRPSAIVTTSGTAVAELYPAIIEAYYQRIPLIVCTADRPHYLRNTGANQTINQNNIYSNHIRFFYDTGLPVIKQKNILRFLNKTTEGFNIAQHLDSGPVHFNFPFEKPFEPDNYTDELNFEPEIIKNNYLFSVNCNIESYVISKIEKAKKVVAIVGPNNFDKALIARIDNILKKKNIPLLADSASGARFIKHNNSVCNHIGFIRFNILSDLKKEDVVLLLGEAPVSNSVLSFIEKADCIKISVNKFGDLKDPSRTINHIIKVDENLFLDTLSESIKIKDEKFIESLKKTDQQVDKIRLQTLNNIDINIESSISQNIINLLPKESNLFIGNSTTIRDFDLFAGKNTKNIKVYTNRGASGIEGNIATTLGIASQSSNPSFMVLGDLAFYYDSNSLLISKQNKIPLTIMVINNNGGGIFSMLPIAEQKDIFEKYFTTPINLELKHLSNLYKARYFNPKSIEELIHIFSSKLDLSKLNIVEIKTDSKKSIEFRKLYIKNIQKSL